MGLNQETQAIFDALGHLSDRVTELQGSMESRPAPLLTEEEHQWVQMAIKREAQTYEFRRAVISKTLAGLLWTVIAASGTLLWTMASDYFTKHGWKP